MKHKKKKQKSYWGPCECGKKVVLSRRHSPHRKALYNCGRCGQTFYVEELREIN